MSRPHKHTVNYVLDRLCEAQQTADGLFTGLYHEGFDDAIRLAKNLLLEYKADTWKYNRAGKRSNHATR